MQKPILLLEEPELGLHPTLQRRLVEGLAKESSLTAFVTTHSPHILDCAGEHVRHYQLRRSGDGTRSVRSLRERDLELLRDLGVRPSSVLQANAIIWVEGPSDAIYLRGWLKAFGGEELVEGSHFSFAHYGGSLLDHLSPGEANEEGKINLFKLNPSWFLFADSDRKAAGERVGHDYLQRFLDVLGNGRDQRSWVTAGKEVESYLSDDELLVALGKQPRNAARTAPDFRRLEDRLVALELPKYWAERKAGLAEKVARAITTWPDRDGLEARVQQLVSFIRDAQAGVIG